MKRRENGRDKREEEGWGKKIKLKESRTEEGDRNDMQRVGGGGGG